MVEMKTTKLNQLWYIQSSTHLYTLSRRTCRSGTDTQISVHCL